MSIEENAEGNPTSPDPLSDEGISGGLYADEGVINSEEEPRDPSHKRVSFHYLLRIKY